MLTSKKYIIGEKFYEFKNGKMTTNLKIGEVRDFFCEVNDTLLKEGDEFYTEEMADAIVRTIHSKDPSKKRDRHYKYTDQEDGSMTFVIDGKMAEFLPKEIKTNMKINEVEGFFEQLNEELEEEGLATFPETFVQKVKEVASSARSEMKPLSKRGEGRRHSGKRGI